MTVILIFLIALAVGFLIDYKDFVSSSKKSKALYISLVVVALAVLCLAEFSDISFSKLVTIS